MSGLWLGFGFGFGTVLKLERKMGDACKEVCAATNMVAMASPTVRQVGEGTDS